MNALCRRLFQSANAEARIRKLNRVYALLSDVNQAIVRVRVMPTLFEQVCQIAVQQSDFRMAWISIVNPESKQLQIVAHAEITQEDFTKMNVLLNNVYRGDGPLGSSLRDG